MSTYWQLKLLEKIAAYFRLLQAAGISREALKSWLEELRAHQPATIIEDRILELLDLIEGYCQPEYRVWTSPD